MKKNIIIVLLMFLILVGAWGAVKPLPKGVNTASPVYTIPPESVNFFYDVTYMNENGTRIFEQSIFDEVFSMIKHAREYIIIDMFLYNDFQGQHPETTRFLSDELTQALIDKKNELPDITIIVISDPINTVYKGQRSSHYDALKKKGIHVVITDLTKLRDSNPIYSSIWRGVFRWLDMVHGLIFQKDYTWRLAPNPFMHDGEKVTFRSYLSLLNFKANHRKLIVADYPTQEGTKMSTLVTSANPHDGSSAHSNVAVRINDFIWQDAILSEEAVALFSNKKIPSFLRTDSILDEDGNVSVRLVTENKIHEQAIQMIENTMTGDKIDMVMFYLSDAKVIDALIRAHVRGAQIRLVLDPNKDAFGHEKNGVPNRPVAEKLIKKSSNEIQIRWCDTHGEQCHSKLLLVKNKSGHEMLLGSANLTRRNVGNYNLETNIWVGATEKIKAFEDAYSYFERIWTNADGNIYTVNYEKFKDNSFVKYVLYNIMERFGTSSF